MNTFLLLIAFWLLLNALIVVRVWPTAGQNWSGPAGSDPSRGFGETEHVSSLPNSPAGRLPGRGLFVTPDIRRPNSAGFIFDFSTSPPRQSRTEP